MRNTIIYIAILFLFFACGQKHKQDKPNILIFCAASLTNVASEIAAEFENKHDVEVKLNFASSGTLARQIEHGANPSLFLSANKKWVGYLNNINKTYPEYEREIAGNSLVVIAPKNSELDAFSFEPLPNFPALFKGRLSLGDPKHVPAGEYAMQAINKGGFKSEIEPRLLPTKDVRSALLVVELGETEAGIVYKTDALKSKKVKIVAEIPEEFHQPIAYYLAVLKSKNNKNTMAFYDFMSSETSQKIWVKHGFKVSQ